MAASVGMNPRLRGHLAAWQPAFSTWFHRRASCWRARVAPLFTLKVLSKSPPVRRARTLRRTVYEAFLYDGLPLRLFAHNSNQNMYSLALLGLPIKRDIQTTVEAACTKAKQPESRPRIDEINQLRQTKPINYTTSTSTI